MCDEPDFPHWQHRAINRYWRLMAQRNQLMRVSVKELSPRQQKRRWARINELTRQIRQAA
jgi:hypothetical protein